MKQLVKRIPVLRSIAKVLYFVFVAPFKSFPGSENYWKTRYASGANSGAGSYDKLARFKADILNDFVKTKQIRTVIEYGSGDGNQLRLADYPCYLGYDISPHAIAICNEIFSDDPSKKFKTLDTYAGERAQLTLSLDVIYHLIEDSVFVAYMERLFDSSTGFVVIYSSNTDKQAKLQAAHVKHRQFSTWIVQNKPEWSLIQHIPNKYPYSGNDNEGSLSDFYIYQRAG